MDFSIFYDNRPQTDCNVNASLRQPADRARCTAATTSTRVRPATTTARCTATPGSRCTSAWGATRCPATCGGGRGGPPAAACSTDPAPSLRPGHRLLADLHRPAVGQAVPGLGGPLHLSGHLADVRADVRRRDVRGADGEPGRARDDVGSPQLRPRRSALGAGPGSSTPPRSCGYPVWGMSPSTTADDTGDYGGFGVEGQAFGSGEPLAWCTTCATENTVSPHASAIALPVLGSAGPLEPREAAEPVPGDLHLGRRVLRRGQPGHGRGRTPPARARPVDDHGRDR